jgi:DNA anti-recombination protein RmuC
MPVAVPRVVRQGWGEEVVEAFVPWLKEEIYEALKEKAVPRDEYREVLSRLDGLEKDVSAIKESLFQTRAGFHQEQAQLRAEFREDQAQMRAEFRDEQTQMRAEFREDLGELRREMHERFDRVNGRFDRMNERFDEMGARFDERLDDMHHQMIVQTRWLIGSLALIGTVVSVLLAIAQFTP